MPRTAKQPSPGPYTVEHQGDKNGWRGISIKDANGHFIANMVMQPGAENEMANAQFLASSAHMKEALEQIAARLGATGGPTKYEIADALAFARDAIKRAEGG
jgi:hypothetical protein